MDSHSPMSRDRVGMLHLMLESGVELVAVSVSINWGVVRGGRLAAVAFESILRWESSEKRYELGGPGVVSQPGLALSEFQAVPSASWLPMVSRIFDECDCGSSFASGDLSEEKDVAIVNLGLSTRRLGTWKSWQTSVPIENGTLERIVVMAPTWEQYVSLTIYRPYG